MEKGFTKITDGTPDFYIIYKYSISRKIYSTPVSTGLGFGYGHYGSAGTIGIRTGTEINEYDEGLLIIDFLKPDSDIVLWRGNSTRVVETHSTPFNNAFKIVSITVINEINVRIILQGT